MGALLKKRSSLAGKVRLCVKSEDPGASTPPVSNGGSGHPSLPTWI